MHKKGRVHFWPCLSLLTIFLKFIWSYYAGRRLARLDRVGEREEGNTPPRSRRAEEGQGEVGHLDLMLLGGTSSDVSLKHIGQRDQDSSFQPFSGQ